MKARTGNRRDLCHLVGVRASKLTSAQAAMAWAHLSKIVLELGEKDMPKFLDLISAIRASTVIAKFLPKAKPIAQSIAQVAAAYHLVEKAKELLNEYHVASPVTHNPAEDAFYAKAEAQLIGDENDEAPD